MPVVLMTSGPVRPRATSTDAVAEANHRIANNLSLIAALVRTQGSHVAKSARLMSGDEVRQILEEFSVRIESVASIHRLLSRRHDEAAVDLGEYLREVAQGTVAALSTTGETTLSFVSDSGCRVDSDKAVSLGVIVAELVTNAIKYAHPAGVPGKVAVECRKRADGTLAIDVVDDGVGLPEDIIPACSNSLGFRLVRSLAEHTQARLAFHSTELGLRIALEIQPTSKRERNDADVIG
jgi:two-component sensor histidine kinase